MSAKKLKKVGILGSGNWAFALATIIARNVVKNDKFENRILVYVYEENDANGRCLINSVNESHRNPIYFPGHKLPSNIVAVPDVLMAAKEADIIVFAIPLTILQMVCSILLGKLKATAVAMSVIKGLLRTKRYNVDMASRVIMRRLRIPCSVLAPATFAAEAPRKSLCEAVLGCRDARSEPLLVAILTSSYFQVTVVQDVDVVEVCAAYQTVIACGVGICDGLGMGNTSMAAIVRLAIVEIIKFTDIFVGQGRLSTFYHGCGLSTFIISSKNSRNRTLCSELARTGKSVAELEQEMYNGQKLQGPATAAVLYKIIKRKGVEDKFPLMCVLHKICSGQEAASQLTEYFNGKSEAVYIPKNLTYP